jgi:hypothetical protein
MKEIFLAGFQGNFCTCLFVISGKSVLSGGYLKI